MENDIERTVIPCLDCGRCKGPCPKGIPIPLYFNVYNRTVGENKKKEALLTPEEDYVQLAESYGVKPSDCIECGLCEKECPFMNDIRQFLKEVANYFEK